MLMLITGAFHWIEKQIRTIESYGFTVRFVEREDSDIPFDVSEIDAVIGNWLFVHHNIHRFLSLKYIQLLSAGHDRVPEDYIKEHHIILNDARGVYSIPIAEFIVCGVLQLYKNSRFFYDNQNQKRWLKNRDIKELCGKKICIVGAGSIGTETAKRFSGFTDEIYGVDLYPTERPYFKEVYPIDMLDQELGSSDVVVLTLPLTTETENMFDRHRFSLMKTGAVFVNAARGGLVDEDALSEALDHKLFGAVCDVFCTEPLSENSELWGKENIIVTPHNSFVSENNSDRMWSVIERNLKDFIEQ